MPVPSPANVSPWYLRNINQALGLDEATGNVFIRTDATIIGNVSVGNVAIGSLGNIDISGNSMPVTGNINIDSLPEVEIKNDVGNPIPVTTSYTSSTVGFAPTQTDAFARLRVSNPYTLFDSQSQISSDPQFDTELANTGNISYNFNESTTNLTVLASGDEVIRQSYRIMSYQPGKSLLVLCSFVMNTSEANARQRVGYFNSDDGVFFEQSNGIKNLVLRSSITGTPSDIRTIPQSSWNGDRLNGSGGVNNPSGLTLETDKIQIFWIDFEWLGAGSVRCGFVINGVFYVCHTFNNANIINSVYMKSANLPIRYEITATDTISGSATLKQVCSSVMSEGGYDAVGAEQVARRTTAVTGIQDTFVPLVSIRLSSSTLNAIVLPNRVLVMPTNAGFYEVALVKNATLAGPTSWNPVPGDSNVEYDVASNAISGGTIVQLDYITSTNQASGLASAAPIYNWSLQLGVSLSGNSDVYSIMVRQLGTTPTVGAIGALTFYDLTDV